MPFAAYEPMHRAGVLLLDQEGARWPFADRLMWITDALREILIHKPTALADSRVIQVAAGTRQALPADAAALVRVVRNITQIIDSTRIGGLAIDTISRVDMDAAMPDWHDQNVHGTVETVTHAVVDPISEPLAWYAFPPQSGAALVEVIVALRPPALAAPLNPTALASYRNVQVPLDPEYIGVVTDYLLYRCFSMEGEIAGSAQRAQAHYSLFANSLGVKLQNEVRFTPARTYAERQP